MPAPRLRLTGISKQYPAVKANDGISLAVQPGEIHALLGENGAGKSTLMKIVFGAVQPDEGQIEVDGKAVRIRNPHDAKAHGIAMVFQHFSLFDTLTAAENVWLGLDSRETLEQVTARMNKKAGDYGLQVDASRPVHGLSVGECQRVEIVRALLSEPKLLILDEPTSVLTPMAVQSLFNTLRQLAQEGCSILYISHKLDEIRELCHQCTVLRGGRVTGSVDPRNETNASLSTLMIGAEPPQLEHREAQLGEVVLELKNLSLAPDSAYGVPLSQVSLQLRAGEVLGIAGVSGNGQQELLAALSGEDCRAPPGSIASQTSLPAIAKKSAIKMSFTRNAIVSPWWPPSAGGPAPLSLSPPALAVGAAHFVGQVRAALPGQALLHVRQALLPAERGRPGEAGPRGPALAGRAQPDVVGDRPVAMGAARDDRLVGRRGPHAVRGR